jgi:hypothetical protein
MIFLYDINIDANDAFRYPNSLQCYYSSGKALGSSGCDGCPGSIDCKAETVKKRHVKKALTQNWARKAARMRRTVSH